MKRKTVKLIPNVSDIKIVKDKNNQDQTTIMFKSELWPKRECFHIVSGQWEIETIVENFVTLVNHDEIIPEPHD